MSEGTGRVARMTLPHDAVQRAAALGQDHAEESRTDKVSPRLHSGRQVAAALGLDIEPGEDLVRLRDAYSLGWSSYW